MHENALTISENFPGEKTPAPPQRFARVRLTGARGLFYSHCTLYTNYLNPCLATTASTYHTPKIIVKCCKKKTCSPNPTHANYVPMPMTYCHKYGLSAS